MPSQDLSRVIAVTGHRPQTLPKTTHQPALWKAIGEWVRDNPAYYIMGGAAGTDQRVAFHAMSYGYPYAIYLPFPFEIFTAKWDKVHRQYLDMLIRSADEVISFLAHYDVSGYMIRDRGMVDDATEVLAVYDGRKKGGTAYTVRYAMNLGFPVHIFDPKEF